MPRPKSLPLLLLLAGAAACSDARSPLGPDARPGLPGSSPSATIYDAAHDAPDSKFYFLPPMVKNPHDDHRLADGSLSPVVEVCEVTAGVCTRLIDRYGATGGSQTNENVRWLGNHYHVNFHAGRYDLDLSKRLRISVFVNDLLIGWADVIVADKAKQLKGIDGDEYVTLTDEQTLPIKFRIHEGIAGSVTVSPPTQTVFKGQTAQYTATVRDLHGQPLPNAPVTWTTSDPTIATVDQSGMVTTYRTGTVTITATSGAASGTAELIVKPRVSRVEVDPVAMNIGNTVTMTARAYDADGNLVTDEPVTWSIRASDGSLVRIVSTSGSSVEIKGLAEGVAVVTATVAEVQGSNTATVSSDIELPTICNTDGLVYFASTTILPDGTCGIRVTPSMEWTAGAAWSTTKQPVAGGFETRFRMRLSNPGPTDFLVGGNTAPGADGLVFVIQNFSQNAVGGQGVGIGYGGMPSSLAVEFDTWFNGGENDPSGNHVSIHTAGIAPNSTDGAYSIGSVNIADDFYDNQVHDVVIRYVPGTMTVSLDGLVILTAPLNLTNINGTSILDANGRAWAGFTSATGAAYGTHDVLSWWMYTPAP